MLALRNRTTKRLRTSPKSPRELLQYLLRRAKVVSSAETPTHFHVFRLRVQCFERKLKKKVKTGYCQDCSRSWIRPSRRRWDQGKAEECRRSPPNAVFVAATQHKEQPLPHISTATALVRETHTCQN